MPRPRRENGERADRWQGGGLEPLEDEDVRLSKRAFVSLQERAYLATRTDAQRIADWAQDWEMAQEMKRDYEKHGPVWLRCRMRGELPPRWATLAKAAVLG